jgi:integrase
VLVGIREEARLEALALKWSDVDFDAKTIAIRGRLQRVGDKLTVVEPKSAKDRRVIPLSADLMTSIRTQRAAQDQERLWAGDQWANTEYVFTGPNGMPLDPRNVRRVFTKAAGAIGVNGGKVRDMGGFPTTLVFDPVDAAVDLEPQQLIGP